MYSMDGESEVVHSRRRGHTSLSFIQPRVASGSLAGPKGYVISWIENQLQQFGFTQDQLMQGGLVVKTTLVKKDQQAAVDPVQSGLLGRHLITFVSPWFRFNPEPERYSQCMAVKII